MTDLGRRRWVTSFDVAQLAGVSRSAVSRCFTPGASIAEETRCRVMEAAELLSYRPNAIARGLNTQRSGLIGVVVADVGNPFYARLVEALAIEIQGRGKAPLVFAAKEAGATNALLPELLSFQVDGVLVTSATLSLSVTRLYDAARTPIVLLDRMAEDDEDVAGDISADNVTGAAMIADLFAETGRRRPALIAGLENTSTSRDRAAGFIAGLSRHGLGLVGEVWPSARDREGCGHRCWRGAGQGEARAALPWRPAAELVRVGNSRLTGSGIGSDELCAN